MGYESQHCGVARDPFDAFGAALCFSFRSMLLLGPLYPLGAVSKAIPNH